MKPIRLVCGTRYSDAQFVSDSALGRSLKLYNHTPPQQLVLFDNNRKGLSKIYNRAIEHAKDNPAILVFVHDDVSICDFFWVERIYEAMARFDIVGLAGNTRRMPRQPAWAFTPELKWDRAEFLSGVVGHGKNGFPCDIVSRFGPAPQPCKLLDGLMLIADSERLVQSGVRFDEQFDFHFYDLDFCRQAELKGLTMGTWPISVIHESIGVYGTPDWLAGYERYLRKYGE
ncbi:MAG TPA: glycosyltransferase [Trinickia sp.]|jgi:GT2 family glycosyltransferase|nr:glycosyltransferase [Trinickia sp.]